MPPLIDATVSFYGEHRQPTLSRCLSSFHFRVSVLLSVLWLELAVLVLA